MVEGFREPVNEKGVFYLFARNHEALGFPKIIEFVGDTTPDLIAIRASDNKKVGIELEYKASSAFSHYCILDMSQLRKIVLRGKWQKTEDQWDYFVDGTKIMSYKEEHDKPVHLDQSRNILLYDSAKSAFIDVIIYWEEDSGFKFWEWDRQVQAINLKREIAKLNP